VRHGHKASAAVSAKRAAPESSESSKPVSAAEKREKLMEGKKVDSKPPPTIGGKTKPSTSTRPTAKAGPEPRAQKREELKADAPAVAAREKREKPSQPSKGAETAPANPPKRVISRTGGVTQPTLSQLARMKAAEEEKERRADAKGRGTTKPLTIRRKLKAIPPKAAPIVDMEIPAAATTTPLPPSPEVKPADIPLPESPAESPVSAPLAVQEEQVAAPTENDEECAAVPVPVEEHSRIPTPTPPQLHTGHPFGVAPATVAKTPISALVHSIQRGFLISPNSPLSPAQPDAEWECPAWPGPHGIVLNAGEEPSFEGVEESTMKMPIVAVDVGIDIDRRALIDMN